MSLFGSSPPAGDNATATTPDRTRGRSTLFDGDTNGGSQPAARGQTAGSLFQDDDAGSGNSSPWDMPTPRKQQTRADVLRNLLPASAVPGNYIDAFDSVARQDGSNGKVTEAGVARTLAAARLSADDHARINSLVVSSAANDGADGGGGGGVGLGRAEFNVLLALVGLAQEGETISLDGVDERRRSKCTCSQPALLSLLSLWRPLSFAPFSRQRPIRSFATPLPSLVRIILSADRHLYFAFFRFRTLYLAC